MTSQLLLAAALGFPLFLLFGCLSARLRENMLDWLPFAPLPALAAALFGGGTLVFDQGLTPMVFNLDGPAAMLLGASALLWIGAGAYAAATMRDTPNRGRFVLCWLLTLIGNIGVLTAADSVGFYLMFALVSIPAYGLIIHDETRAAEKAGLIYISLTVLGETFLIIGLILLAAGAPGHSLLIRDGVAALPLSPWRDAALAFIIAGFASKIGLTPFHVFMPLSYKAAPIPAAAVLSGAAVKAGIIGFIRFLPFDVPQPVAGEFLAAIGMISAFYGAAVGLTQNNPKVVLAYSSISQMGVLAAIFGMGLASGNVETGAAAGFYAANHVLVKGGLFLALGVAATASSSRLLLAPAVLLALGLGGLPLTGGFLAKIVAKGPLGSGLYGALSALSAVATTVLMLHFLKLLGESLERGESEAASPIPQRAWLVVAAAAILVPWTIYFAASGDWAKPLSLYGLWETLWPVLLGFVLFIALRARRDRLPQIPEGDVLALAERFKTPSSWGGALDRFDTFSRQWPTAALALLSLALILTGFMHR